MANLPDFFGLNLGHFSIKLAEAKRISETKVRIDTLNSTPTVVGMLENDSPEGINTLAAEIKKAVINSGIRTKNVVMSVPEVGVFSRLITLPKVNNNEVSEAIQWALKPLVPVSLEEVNISYLEIDERTVDGNTFSNWYVVAAPKNVILRYQQVMEKAGFTLLAVETEALAISRMVAFNYPADIKKDLMLLDLGAESTNVILTRNGVVMFSQTISTGSNAITKVISTDFGIDMIQAEKYKITYGIDFQSGDGKIAKSIEPIIQIFLGEIQRTLVYYKEKIGGVQLSGIFLTGGGADLPKIDIYLSEKMKLPVIVANPLVNMEVSRQVGNNLKNLHLKSFNVALGLCLKGTLV